MENQDRDYTIDQCDLPYHCNECDFKQYVLDKLSKYADIEFEEFRKEFEKEYPYYKKCKECGRQNPCLSCCECDPQSGSRPLGGCKDIFCEICAKDQHKLHECCDCKRSLCTVCVRTCTRGILSKACLAAHSPWRMATWTISWGPVQSPAA